MMPSAASAGDERLRDSPGSFVTWWRRTHFENSMIDALLHRTHTPYREIGQRAAMDEVLFGATPHQPDIRVPDMKSLADTMV